MKALLALRERYAASATAVEVLYTGRDPFAQKLFVDKGTDAGIAPGEAVIDADGVVGQVTRVFPFMAEVTLVSDKDHAVPVKVVRTGVRSVLFGSGTGRSPELRFTAPNADIEVGDVLVTSGIDGTYPPGLAVAQVATLERDTGQMFARITARPLAGADRSMHLLVLAPAAALPPRPDEPPEAEAAKKGGRSQVAEGRLMALSRVPPLMPARPEEILRPARPWFVLLTLALAFVGNLLPFAGVARGAEARFRRAGAAVLVHPGAPLRRRGHRVVHRPADGCRRRDAVRPACARLRGARVRRRVLPPPRAALPAVAAGGPGRTAAGALRGDRAR